MSSYREGRQGFLSRTETIRILKTVFLGAISVVFLACNGGTGTGDGLGDLRKNQKAILERLEKIEKTQKEMMAAWQQRTAKKPSVDYDKVYDIEVGHSPVQGAENAKVTLVEFSDFQCPYSQRAQPLIHALLEAYPDDLRHVYKNFPLGFHKQAMPAAKACVAAGMQGKFWEMEERLFDNPRKLEEEDLRKYAKEIGLDVARFEKDCSGEEVQKLVDADLAAAKKAQVTGTPTLFLNGKRVRNRSEDAMKEEIKTILEGKEKS
jgi:protein-disulfide isomerase